ncbi:hypothetical protein [Micromonospora sp. NPDC002717]|uniref:hypothetical protein n=1 Tax=Micromonospora sp. NPDC002717 TaxID=3154424 RepID=UPI00332B1732
MLVFQTRGIHRAHLHDHARVRGAVLPTRLLRYRNGRPISSRRYDHLWKRIGERLPWVAAQGLSTHWLRHTTLTWVGRHFGYGVARAYAGHTDSPGSSTTIYIKADLHAVADALSAMIGQPHPLVTARETSHGSATGILPGPANLTRSWAARWGSRPPIAPQSGMAGEDSWLGDNNTRAHPSVDPLVALHRITLRRGAYLAQVLPAGIVILLTNLTNALGVGEADEIYCVGCGTGVRGRLAPVVFALCIELSFVA